MLKCIIYCIHFFLKSSFKLGVILAASISQDLFWEHSELLVKVVPHILWFSSLYFSHSMLSCPWLLHLSKISLKVHFEPLEILSKHLSLSLMLFSFFLSFLQAKNKGLVMVNFFSYFLTCSNTSTVHDVVGKYFLVS